jgi:hypothetical protein
MGFSSAKAGENATIIKTILTINAAAIFLAKENLFMAILYCNTKLLSRIYILFFESLLGIMPGKSIFLIFDSLLV